LLSIHAIIVITGVQRRPSPGQRIFLRFLLNVSFIKIQDFLRMEEFVGQMECVFISEIVFSSFVGRLVVVLALRVGVGRSILKTMEVAREVKSRTQFLSCVLLTATNKGEHFILIRGMALVSITTVDQEFIVMGTLVLCDWWRANCIQLKVIHYTIAVVRLAIGEAAFITNGIPRRTSSTQIFQIAMGAVAVQLPMKVRVLLALHSDV
jgi:hypothetical protein